MNTLEQLVRELVSRPSVTPEDAGCQALLQARLEAIGFTCESMDAGGVTNLYARRGDAQPVVCFAGHTDVVPAGPLDEWQSPPFTPEIRDGCLFGRGTADMKGSIAAMICAIESFTHRVPDHAGAIAMIITSDEEGPARHGTREVMARLAARNERLDYCVVGEPSSSKALGDVVRIGRRGSLHAIFDVDGKQGHVAYPDKALNPIHASAPLISALSNEVWDEGNAHFPPTTFQISNIEAGTGANNVIPGSLRFVANFRYSTAVTADDLKRRCEAMIDALGIDARITWSLSGEPFLSEHGPLTQAVAAAIKHRTGLDTELSTGGGTSDGRFIAPSGTEVIELGPINQSIHQIDERVDLADLDTLALLYEDVMLALLGGEP
ncbi:MAG: succinyl-diaminopimelate desuccinylase [Pseudomonadota bacterium]